MTAEQPHEFVDANVLVYAFDASAGRKQQAAAKLLERLWESGGGCLSVQVGTEFPFRAEGTVRQIVPDARSFRIAVAGREEIGGMGVRIERLDTRVATLMGTPLRARRRSGICRWIDRRRVATDGF